jgi:hypothetical protein
MKIPHNVEYPDFIDIVEKLKINFWYHNPRLS